MPYYLLDDGRLIGVMRRSTAPNTTKTKYELTFDTKGKAEARNYVHLPSDRLDQLLKGYNAKEIRDTITIEELYTIWK